MSAGWLYYAIEPWLAYRVELDWSDVSGAISYNVYRGDVSGGPYTQLNSSAVLTSDYIDTTVVPDSFYYYVVTALDVNGFESAYSGELSFFTGILVVVEQVIFRSRSPYIYY